MWNFWMLLNRPGHFPSSLWLKGRCTSAEQEVHKAQYTDLTLAKKKPQQAEGNKTTKGHCCRAPSHARSQHPSKQCHSLTILYKVTLLFSTWSRILHSPYPGSNSTCFTYSCRLDFSNRILAHLSSVSTPPESVRNFLVYLSYYCYKGHFRPLWSLFSSLQFLYFPYTFLWWKRKARLLTRLHSVFKMQKHSEFIQSMYYSPFTSEGKAMNGIRFHQEQQKKQGGNLERLRHPQAEHSREGNLPCLSCPNV